MKDIFLDADALFNSGKELWTRALSENDEAVKRRLLSAAADKFEAALRAGCARPMPELGAAYLMGMGRETDYAMGFNISLYAAQKGSAMAANNVAVCYDKGLGTSADEREAARWYLFAAQKGYKGAYWPAAYRLLTGRGIAKDLREAMKLGRKAVACREVSLDQYDKYFKTVPEGTDASDAFDIAYEAYKNEDFEEAVIFYTYAAEHGHREAKTNLALAYELGRGVPADKSRAIALYTQAAAEGCNCARTNLALFYAKGVAVPQNHTKARYLLRQAMEEGYERAFKRYQDYYPDEYDAVAAEIRIARGEAKPGDYYSVAAHAYRTGNYDYALTTALQLHQDYSDPDACLLIADAYLCGNGIEKDFNNAYRWVLIALSDGVPSDPQNIMMASDLLQSLCCLDGYFGEVEREYALHTAYALLYMLALTGHAGAEYELAKCLSRGEGCEVDYERALRFLQSAAAHGNPAAIELMRKAEMEL